jgi:nitrogen fixation protein NifU and related proteins
MLTGSSLTDQDQSMLLDDGCDNIQGLGQNGIGTHMYSDRLLDHFQNPRNVGELPPPAVTVEANNPACGDILRISVRFEDSVVTEARYKTRGCTASIAAGSALTEWMAGKSRADLAAINPADVENLVGGLEPESKHAAVLCADAVKLLLKRL